MQLGYDQTAGYRYTDRYLAAVDKVSAADVQRVATNYLAPAKRTVNLFEPTQLNGQTSPGEQVLRKSLKVSVLAHL